MSVHWVLMLVILWPAAMTPLAPTSAFVPMVTHKELKATLVTVIDSIICA